MGLFVGKNQVERTISTGLLKHCCFCTSGLSTWSSSTALKGELVLRWVSRLDAFSGYPIRTWLPSFYSWRNNWFTSGTSIPVLSY